ncbi:unnamed protein product [Auanema sp. JU1783]|nr:unnamed protein product [Auanema sp. JU1783]
MLKYSVARLQQYNIPSTSSPIPPPRLLRSSTSSIPSLQHDVTLTRSNSLLSLNSFDSNSSESDTGSLKIYTNNVKTCADYKTIRVSNFATTEQVIETVINKFKLSSCRDTNLYKLWMEVSTRTNGKTVSTILELDRLSRPLELQRCHPENMSRFILHMCSSGSLVKIYDHNISPESNYKSLMMAPETTAEQTIKLVFQMNRKEIEPDSNYALFLISSEGEAQIPNQVPIVPIAVRCGPEHKIIIREVDSL